MEKFDQKMKKFDQKKWKKQLFLPDRSKKVNDISDEK